MGVSVWRVKCALGRVRPWRCIQNLQMDVERVEHRCTGTVRIDFHTNDSGVLGDCRLRSRHCYALAYLHGFENEAGYVETIASRETGRAAVGVRHCHKLVETLRQVP